MSGVVRPVFTWSSDSGDPERPDRCRAMPGHPPQLARHLDRRSLAVGAGHRDDRLRIRAVETRGELGKQPARLRRRQDAARVEPMSRPSHDGNRPAFHRVADEVLAVEDGALEGAEDAARGHLAMVDGKARHFGIAIDAREIAQIHCL